MIVEHQDVLGASALMTAEFGDGLAVPNHIRGFGSTKAISDIARATCEFLVWRTAGELRRLA